MSVPPPVAADGMLPVGQGHEIFWEESGAPDGVPALYLHGGPGGRLTPGYRRNSPADRARLIGTSQRGAGRSTPGAGAAGPVDLHGQDTARLVADLERLREHRGIEAWILPGVSWGSTLALAYAQAHPQRVLAVVLFAVTSTSRREVDWITEGVGSALPEAWDRFASHAERADIGYRRGRGRIVEAYAQLMASQDPQVRDAAAAECGPVVRPGGPCAGPCAR